MTDPLALLHRALARGALDSLDPDALAELRRQIDARLPAPEPAADSHHTYWRQVRGLAEDYVRGDWAEPHDWLLEQANEHTWVIYTHLARRVLIYTDNPDAWEEYHSARPDPSREAFHSLMADVYDMADRLESDQ